MIYAANVHAMHISDLFVYLKGLSICNVFAYIYLELVYFPECLLMNEFKLTLISARASYMILLIFLL